MLEAGVRLPERGAAVLIPRGISGVAIPGGATFPPAGTNPPQVQFRWPAKWLIRAIQVTVNTGLAADLAKLSLQILDEQGLNITTDGEGQQFQASCMAFGGNPTGFGGAYQALGPRPWAMQRIVRPNDIWKFRWANSSVGGSLTPELVFYLAVVK